MRHVDVDRLREIMGDEEYERWREEAVEHVESIRGLSHEERSAYFQRHNNWVQLYQHLSYLSHNKCWYSESPEGASEFEIDHFRPKNRSRNADGVTILEDGYWWLAYDETNFRLSGSLVNRRRRDRFDPTKKVVGKGDYFPLDLEQCQACEPEGDLDYEVTYLLDPTNFQDVTLIAFDKDGKVVPTFRKGTFEYERASVSIDFLGLDHTPLNRQRQTIWKQCEIEIEKAAQKIKSNMGGSLRAKDYKRSTFFY